MEAAIPRYYRISRSLIVVILSLLFCTTRLTGEVVVSSENWGHLPDGQPVELFTLRDGSLTVQISNYGARIVAIRAPDRSGRTGDIVLGFPNLEPYLEPRNAVMGATVGRFANRIAHGRFSLDGTEYTIPINNNGNALHGGTVGFNKKVWSPRIVKNGVEMSLVSPDGDMGFPGSLSVRVIFTLIRYHHNPALSIQYRATTDRTTVVNLTNHAYFNLSMSGQEPVFEDIAWIDAAHYTPTDATSIPTGQIESVHDTAFDFTTPHPIADKIPERGYDQNFVLNSHRRSSPNAEVRDPKSGRTLQVITDQPGLQFYVPRFPAPPAGAQRAGIAAFCLETQHFPDSPNRTNFPTTTLQPGKIFSSQTVYVPTVDTKH